MCPHLCTVIYWSALRASGASLIDLSRACAAYIFGSHSEAAKKSTAASPSHPPQVTGDATARRQPGACLSVGARECCSFISRLSNRNRCVMCVFCLCVWAMSAQHRLRGRCHPMKNNHSLDLLFTFTTSYLINILQNTQGQLIQIKCHKKMCFITKLTN